MANPTQTERRRSQRVQLAIPVEVAWTQEDGVPVNEHAETEVLNAHGALLRMKPHFPIPIEVRLSRPRTRLSAQARVVGFREPTPGGFLGVAVELAAPSETFWGVSFPAVSRTVTRPPRGREDPRQQPRVNLVTQVESRSSGATSLGYTKSISAGGLLVESRDTFESQTNVIVRFNLPSGRAVQTDGVVVHSESGVHMRIRFMQLKDDDRNNIEDFVQQITSPQID